MDIRRVFGINVRLRRLKASLSQEALAERLGVDRAFVSSMERGQANVTLTTLWQVASAFSAASAELLDESVSPDDYDPKVKAPRRPRTRPAG
jgi:transcriptional regulator with XRE-family HTH domain